MKHILQFANREKLPERDEKEGSKEDSKLCNRSQKIVLGFSYKFYDKYLTDYVVMSGISPPELTRLKKSVVIHWNGLKRRQHKVVVLLNVINKKKKYLHLVTIAVAWEGKYLVAHHLKENLGFNRYSAPTLLPTSLSVQESGRPNN